MTEPADPRTIREDFVQNAFLFLVHPNVVGTPLSRKIAFLKSKGLSDDEIQEAMNRADSNYGIDSSSTSPVVHSRWRYAAIGTVLLAIGGFTAFLFTKYVIPWFAKKEKRKKSKNRRRDEEKTENLEALLTRVLEEQENNRTQINRLREAIERPSSKQHPRSPIASPPTTASDGLSSNFSDPRALLMRLPKDSTTMSTNDTNTIVNQQTEPTSHESFTHSSVNMNEDVYARMQAVLTLGAQGALPDIHTIDDSPIATNTLSETKEWELQKPPKKPWEASQDSDKEEKSTNEDEDEKETANEKDEKR